MTSAACTLVRRLFSLIVVVGLASAAFAQDSVKPATPVESNPPAATDVADPLAGSQEAITQRYHRFEDTLHQLSEYLRKTDPQRAQLLFQAKGKSQERQVNEQLIRITKHLKLGELGEAVEREEEVLTHMQAVLDLLMSEDRRDEIEKERARIKDLIKDVDNLISKQTDARINTERGGDPTDLQRQQKQVADKTQKVVDKVQDQDAKKKAEKQKADGKSDESDKPGDKSDSADKNNDDQGKPGDKSDPSGKPKDPSDKENPPKAGSGDKESKPGDAKPSDPKPGDPKEGETKPSDPKSGEPKPGDPKPGDPKEGKPSESKPGKPQSGKPQSGKPQEGSPQEQPQDSPQQDSPQNDQNQGDDAQKSDKTPGRDDLEKAKKEMDRAIEELKKNRNSKASDRQDQALADLMKAKEKLEEILRQLREEERAMVLAALEARFNEMLKRQEAVNNGTLGIHAVPVDKRSDRHRNRSVELARNEEEISLMAAKALTLLREEGSSVAFPEAVEQIRDDMLTVTRRLERADVGEITQNIEQDIVESLRELLEALQKEIEKLKDQQQQQQQQQQQKQQSPLVNKLAELKMLRSLQYRVNRRTKQMGRLVEGEQAIDADLVTQLRQLSDRQSKVQRATHDLAAGKNE
ncbi:MAG: hypothetical protein JWP89_1733 [Schlesneria sp.]|nr:hypothetical protein [Schlesneria sp.]